MERVIELPQKNTKWNSVLIKKGELEKSATETHSLLRKKHGCLHNLKIEVIAVDSHLGRPCRLKMDANIEYSFNRDCFYMNTVC